jgi:hypothetical protein
MRTALIAAAVFCWALAAIEAIFGGHLLLAPAGWLIAGVPCFAASFLPFKS